MSPPTGCLTTGVCYTPQSSEYSAAIGKTSTFNGVNLSETYNTRLQPLEIKGSSSGGNAFDITYSFVDPTTSGNAGHVNSTTNNLDTTRSQTFSYDHLNRITAALTTSTYATSPSHCWGEAYTLDAWGNLNSIAATTNSSYTGCREESGFSTTADGYNHLPIFGYDLSGNTQSDGTIGYTYDAESQIKTAAGVTYLYDGSGRRVSKSSGKLYWYGSGGEILAETTAAGATLNEYIFFGGKRVAMLPAGGNPEYYAEDFLGSSRVTTTNNGTVCYDADFYPYGGERAYTNNCPSANVYKFEGKERDTETGNDDFGARYYSNRFGRWLSADWSSTPVPVPYANLTNPQTLNLYSMVSDDPESFADLDGHADCCSFWQVVNFLAGAANAYGSDNLAGAGRQEQTTTEGKIGAAAGDTIAAVQGVTEVVLGGAGEIGGTALDASGVGAIAGVPLNVVSAIPLAHGGATATEAVGHLGAAAGDAINNAIHAPVEKKATGPVKSADAPGVTAGGQATDEHGNKLGPSGETMVNRTRSNTRERANNRARDQGSRTVEHSNPRKGKPHFHPADKQGEKKPSSTHHEYPD